MERLPRFRALAEYLKNDYRVISLDFQGISTEDFKSEFTFTKAFMRLFEETLRRGENDQNEAYAIANCWMNCHHIQWVKCFRH